MTAPIFFPFLNGQSYQFLSHLKDRRMGYPGKIGSRSEMERVRDTRLITLFVSRIRPGVRWRSSHQDEPSKSNPRTEVIFTKRDSFRRMIESVCFHHLGSNEVRAGHSKFVPLRVELGLAFVQRSCSAARFFGNTFHKLTKKGTVSPRAIRQAPGLSPLLFGCAPTNGSGREPSRALSRP